MNNVVQIKSDNLLDTHARRIRTLMENWTENTIALGQELLAARGMFPGKGTKRPGWHAWLKTTQINPSSAAKLIQVAEKFGDARARASLSSTSREVLIMLSRDNVPENARKEVIERVAKGEKVGRQQVKKIVDSHRPKPKEADKQARETGKAVLASDGYIYLGSDKENVAAATERRTVVFAVRRAIEALALLELTPQQFLDTALEHQLHGLEIKEIRRAAKWLEGLNAAWSRK